MNVETSVAPALTRIPAIQTGQALQSLRDSGHSLPTALGEPIDNALEAKANLIQIHLEQAINKANKKHVHMIAVSDDGTGMDVETLHRYPVIGFSTRYMQTNTIGKYGVGAKLAALNFGRRIDVWSRIAASSPWLHVYFDLDEALSLETDGGQVGIEPPNELAVPENLTHLLPSGSGTLVMWSRVDRLEDGRTAANFDELRLELEKELARIFRYFISGGIKIKVNDTDLIAHDPLMQFEDSWTDFVLTREATADKKSRSKTPTLQHFPSTIISEKDFVIGGGKVEVTVTLYPKEVVRKRGMGGDKLAKELRVPENLGAISFVRKSREVSYTNVPRIFPAGVQDPDRFIGIEVSFSPELDDYFGIRNVKRGVEPHGELREKIRKILEGALPTARKMLEDIWGVVSREDHDKNGEHSAILVAVKEVDETMPKGRVDDASSPEVVKTAFKQLAQEVVGADEKEQAEYLEKIKSLPYVIESVDFPGNMFISTQHLAGKVLIRLNTRHPFYREMWEPIRQISDRDAGTVSGDEAVKAARRTIEALTLLLIAYGKAESMHHNPAEQYDELTQYWGQFLSTMLKKVKNVY